MKAKQTEVLTIRISKEDKELIIKKCAETGYSQREIIINAIKEQYNAKR